MKTKLKDVIHLYVGCDVVLWANGNAIEKLYGFSREKSLVFVTTRQTKNVDCGRMGINWTCPILRKLSDMTAKEKKKASSLSGLVALGTANVKTGDKNLIMQEAEHIAYLLKIGIDLFGLIESKQAVDKKELKHYLKKQKNGKS